MTEETVRPAHFGLLGPVISFEEGDTVFVHLKNSLHFPISFQLEGVIMAKEEDGTFMKGGEINHFVKLVGSYEHLSLHLDFVLDFSVSIFRIYEVLYMHLAKEVKFLLVVI